MISLLVKMGTTIYYTNAVTSDYALITDFNPNQGDIIQLRDYSESRYFVKPSPSGLPTGTAIYFGFHNEVTDLIAIVQRSVDLNFSGNYFKFDSSPQEIDYGDCNCTLPESPPPLY